MAKVSIKSEKIIALGGIFFVLDKFDRILSSVIDSHLGLRSTLIGYQYSEIIRAVFSVFFCGGDCMEDLNLYLKDVLAERPHTRVPSADTVLPNTFCSTRAVFSRISKEDLRELVYTPVEGSEKILDIDTDCSKPVSDSEIKSFLVDSQGIVNPLMVQSLEKSRRNEVLRTMLSLGAGIRQLSRLTGVSFGVIQKLAK